MSGELEVKMLNPTDEDYPSNVMKFVPFKEKYQLFKISHLTVVPLVQVIDALSIMPDYIVKDGIKYCPLCLQELGEKYKGEGQIDALEKIKADLLNLEFNFHYDWATTKHIIEIIDKHISELKGENSG